MLDYDFKNKSVFICASPHLFVRDQDEDDPIVTEGCISFVTEHGFFAALGHNENPNSLPYEEAGVYALPEDEEEPLLAGQVLCSTPAGIYGAFYDDYTPPVVAQLEIAALQDLEADTAAELWMPIESGELHVFKGTIVALFPDKPHPVLFLVQDESFPGASFGSSGSVIVQGGKLVAILAGANDDPATLLYCTSAEQMAEDLGRMMLELATTEEGTE